MQEKYVNSNAIKASYSYEVHNLINKSRLFRELIPDSDIDPKQSGHPGEEGKWTESLLASFLKKHLPPNLKVSTGFIINPQTNKRSYQIDILIYDPAIAPPLFEYGDGVIVHPSSVAGAISTKYKITRQNITHELEQLSEIGELCSLYHRRGPYLCLFGYNLEFEEYKSRKWVRNLNFYSDKILNLYSNVTPHMNSVVDSVISLDGAIIHMSKGQPDQRKEQVKILYAGINWGSAESQSKIYNSCYGEEFMLLSEIIEGILKFNKYQDKITWPTPDGNKFFPYKKFAALAFREEK